MPQTVDLDALAKKFGGKAEQPSTDLDAIARQFGGASDTQRTETTDQPSSASSRFFSNLGSSLNQTLNPVEVAKGLYQMGRHPVDTLRAGLQAQDDQLEQAKTLFREGRYSEAIGHGAAGLLPIVGPMAATIGEQAGSGDIAGAAGQAVGLFVAPTAAVKGLGAAASAARSERVVNALDTAAQRRGAAFMAPTAGPNKTRLGVQAMKVSPDVIRETSALTRAGALEQAQSKLEQASMRLESGYDAAPQDLTFSKRPIMDGLDVKIRNLSVGTMEPENRAARINALKQAKAELAAAPPVLKLRELRSLKQAWAEGGKKVFTPVVAEKAFETRGSGHGWADAQSVVDDYMVSKFPGLSERNADVSLWIKATDVMQAAEEADLVKSGIGRAMTSRAAGAVGGAFAHGLGGALFGIAVAPLVERAASAAAPAVRITTARGLSKLADVLRRKDFMKARTILRDLDASVPPVTGEVLAASERPPSAPTDAPDVEGEVVRGALPPASPPPAGPPPFMPPTLGPKAPPNVGSGPRVVRGLPPSEDVEPPKAAPTPPAAAVAKLKPAKTKTAPVSAPVDTPVEAAQEVVNEIRRVVKMDDAPKAVEVQRRVIAALQEQLKSAEMPSSYESVNIAGTRSHVQVPVGVGKIVVEVPGDGTFTIHNTPDAIQETIRKVQSAGSSVWGNKYPQRSGIASQLSDAQLRGPTMTDAERRVRLRELESGDKKSKGTHTFTIALPTGPKEIMGFPESLPELPDVQFFTHQLGPKSWGISEAVTGLSGGHGETREAAIENLREYLKKPNAVKILKDTIKKAQQ